MTNKFDAEPDTFVDAYNRSCGECDALADHPEMAQHLAAFVRGDMTSFLRGDMTSLDHVRQFVGAHIRYHELRRIKDKLEREDPSVKLRNIYREEINAHLRDTHPNNGA